MEKLTGLGEDEDDWDRILREKFGLQEQGGSWTEESVKYHERIQLLHYTSLERRNRISRQMTKIVEREKVLAQGERATWRGRTYVQQRVQLLIRHGREQEAKALADKTGLRFKGVKAPTARKGTDKNAISASASEGSFDMSSGNGKPLLDVSSYSTSPEARKPRIALNDSTLDKGNDATKVDAVQPQKEVMWIPHLAMAQAPAPLNQLSAEDEQKHLTRRRIEASISKKQASTRENQSGEPGRIRYKYDYKAPAKREAERSAFTELGMRSPKQTLGGVSLADAMGGSERR